MFVGNLLFSGNPLILRDTAGNDIITIFDALGRKQTITDPNMGNKSFYYNSFGEVVEQVDGTDNHSFYAYDNVGRLITQYSNVDNNKNPKASQRSYYDIYLYDLTTMGKLARIFHRTMEFTKKMAKKIG